MSTICSSPDCAHPQANGYLCRNCAWNFRKDLKAVPGLLDELEVTISRQDKISVGDGRGSEDNPLPIRLGPMESRRVLRETMHAWANSLFAFKTPPDQAHAVLTDWIDEIVLRPEAGDCADEIGYAVVQARRAVDHPRLRASFMVGPCPETDGAGAHCDGYIWAYIPSAADEMAKMECQDCGVEWNTTQWLRTGARMLKRIEELKRNAR